MVNKRLSILLMLLSSLSFAFMGAGVKYTSGVPLFHKVFMRDVVVVLITLLFMWKRRVNPFGHRENRLRLTLRGLSGFVGVALYFYSVSKLFLADATILNKLSPFFTTLFAVLLLNEKIPRIQIPALLLGLTGGILVIKPGLSLDMIPALAGFAGSIVAGFSYAMVLNLTDKEDPFVVVFYFSISSVLCSLIPAISTYVSVPLSAWIALIATGVFAALGQITLTYSYKFSKASDVSIYSYSLIIFSLILGYVLWDEVPDSLSFLGGILIMISGIAVYVSYKMRKKYLQEI